jgi:hypothetical protein
LGCCFWSKWTRELADYWLVSRIHKEKRTFSPDLLVAPSPGCCHPALMLTELYIEALLVDEALADEVWTLWDAGLISDELAARAWCQIGCGLCSRLRMTCSCTKK